VLYILVLFAVISTVDMTVYMYCQKYFQGMGIPVFAIGIILAVDSLFAALGGNILTRWPGCRRKGSSSSSPASSSAPTCS